jgi:hypothetical protein
MVPDSAQSGFFDDHCSDRQGLDDLRWYRRVV